ncbi:ATP-binding protein [Alteribacter populi]|uniref:ATP-binding protein n=1 Tax=Alteribacter populi TaxID=2011011 RepID=UPI001FDF6A22|nr:sensor histidine kinase [Alteribacter populi]
MAGFDRHQMKRYITKPHVRMSLKLKMVLLIGLLIVSMLTIIGVFFYQFLADSLEQQIGEQALGVSGSVAQIPELREAFSNEDPAATIQPLIEPIREAAGAEFIVVGNTEEIRYSHPNPNRIGSRMIGEDNEGALLRGESYVSKAEGSLGPSIRGKTPVVNERDEIIGVVSVGFLVEDVQGVVKNYSDELFYALLLVVAIGFIGAILIAIYIKRVLFGLEPEEISYLLLQKETILQSAHEGIIAVNSKGNITLVNVAAQRLLASEEEPVDRFIGLPIQSVLPNSKLPEVLVHGKSQYDQEMQFGNHIVVVNRVPIYYEGVLVGAVSTFRNKTEIERLTKELTRVKEYADGLRAQTHEFSNKLYTILGLIQLDQKEEAVDFIREENNVQQEWIRLLIEKVPDPLISAILLGKLNQANELRVQMDIDPESTLTFPLSNKKRHVLVTVLGNLIENAIDAVKSNPPDERHVSVFFTDIGQDIVFEIEDLGDGVPAEVEQKIFEQGFSTKEGSNRGIGLALTKQLLTNVDGTISIEAGSEGGACFVITVPKQEGGNYE